MTRSNLHVEIACRHYNCGGGSICGDRFLFRNDAGSARTIAVLSDGLGHGIKANILANFTSTMITNFVSSHEDISVSAARIMKMLPVCLTRKISYSTFTLVDIDRHSGEVRIAQHANPAAILLRNGIADPLQWSTMKVEGEGNSPFVITSARFNAIKGDRLILTTDGVTQSGQRNGNYRFGWGERDLGEYLSYLCSVNNSIKASDLCGDILSKARMNDGGDPADDMSCAALYFREPRAMMLVSCPPSVNEKTAMLAEVIKDFNGDKIICGHPVARMLADFTGSPLEMISDSSDPLSSPVYRMDGFDLVTEGVIVLTRVLEILENPGGKQPGAKGVADRFVDHLLRNDVVEMAVGLRKSIDIEPGKPDIFDIRRDMLKRIAVVLESDYGKKVHLCYI